MNFENIIASYAGKSDISADQVRSMCKKINLIRDIQDEYRVVPSVGVGVKFNVVLLEDVNQERAIVKVFLRKRKISKIGIRLP